MSKPYGALNGLHETAVLVWGALTGQGADELIHFFHVPLGGVTGKEVLCEEGQLSPCGTLSSGSGPGAGGRQWRGGLLIARDIRALAGLLAGVRGERRGDWPAQGLQCGGLLGDEQETH